MASILRVTVLFGTLLSSALPLEAKNLGVVGQTFSISEEDMMDRIQNKLKDLEKTGELQKHQDQLKAQAIASVQRPKPVAGITKAQKTRIFYYDPSFYYPHDLKGLQGKRFYTAGTAINPLSYMTYTRELIFIDGDDKSQKEWCWQYFKNSPVRENIRIILIKGAPLKLSSQWQQPIYFDQGGALATQLKIQHVPALVKRDGAKLQITEIKIEEKKAE